MSLENVNIDKYTQWVYYVIEVIHMTIREMRMSLGDTQGEFAARYHIPFRTIQNWEAGVRNPPEYIVSLLEHKVRADLINHRTAILPANDTRKLDLPRRQDYLGALAWLSAVRAYIGEDTVFALDEALMCQGLFAGRSDEYLVWVYGDDSLSRFNGVVVLGNRINDRNVRERNGLKYTDLNRTVSDALANEDILDMQGITEGLSKYYYRNGESLEGIIVAPEHQEKFEQLIQAASEYYTE